MHVYILISLEGFYTVGFRGKSTENEEVGSAKGVGEASFVVASRYRAPSKRLHQGRSVCFDLRVKEGGNRRRKVAHGQGGWPAEIRVGGRERGKWRK